MAKGDTVYSLFGLQDPQELARQQFQQTFSYKAPNDPYMQAGAGLGQLGLGLARMFGGPSEAVQQAQTLEEIAKGYQPGNIQNMTETYTRLKEAGAPAETLNRLSADITTASQAFNERAQEKRAQSAAVSYVSQANPELGNLVASGAMDAGEAIKSIQESQKPIKVGDVLVDPTTIDPKTKQAAVVFDARKRTPNTTYQILTDQEKEALGLPVNVQYQRSSAGKVERIAGVDLPQMGTVPQGYQVVVGTGDNPGQTTVSMQPIPGSPQAKALEDQLKATQAKTRNTGNKVNLVTSTIDELTNTNKSGILDNADAWAAGKAGKVVDVLGQLSGGILSAETQQDILKNTLVTLKANIGFDRLQLMREESPTGGALGQVAIQELDALQNSIASLNPSIGKEQLKKNLNKVRGQYEVAAEALANAYTDQQLVAAGVPHIIAYRTGEINPETGEFELFPSDQGFDITTLPQDVQDTWEFMTEEERALWK